MLFKTVSIQKIMYRAYNHKVIGLFKFYEYKIIAINNG